VVVSHDRYFLERVTDSVWALMGDGQISMLPGGVDQYLAHRKTSARDQRAASRQPTGPSASEERSGGARSDLSGQLQATGSQEAAGNQRKKAKVGGADERAARKTVARIDKQMARLEAREVALTEEMAVADPEKLESLSAELRSVSQEKAALEAEWLEAAALLE
jgi:ATP-binding cassette subfamily F protein uup